MCQIYCWCLGTRSQFPGSSLELRMVMRWMLRIVHPHIRHWQCGKMMRSCEPGFGGIIGNAIYHKIGWYECRPNLVTFQKSNQCHWFSGTLSNVCIICTRWILRDLFNMNELCTLLNRSFPSFLQRVLPKGNAFCTKGNPYYFRKNVKRVIYIYIHFGIKFHCLGGILCLPHRPHSFLKIKWDFAHILQGITYAFW